jgi:hypothetical protein
MAIKRYFADIDNTITNAFEFNLRTRATGANMGQADILEAFSIYAQASTSSSELARFLLQFPTADIASDRSSGTIAASGSIKFYLKLYNAPHSFTTPKDYTLAVRAISGSWQEGHGLDMDNYTDLVYENPGSNWVFASNSTSSATATVTVTDGDAANGMTEKQHITLISTDGTTKRYVLTNAASDSGTATGTVLSDSDNTDTGAGTAGANEDGGVAVSINLSSATQNDYLVQLKAAIEHANGHNGKITVSAVPGAADGNQSITLTQASTGRAGNRTTTEDLANVTATNFAGGDGEWVNTGGDYYDDANSNFTETFELGTEDLEVDITTLVEQWINSAGNVLGAKDNHGLAVMLTSSLETAARSYYTKKFFGRGTEFFFKRPVIEARWDSSRQDDRGNFYYSSSLAGPEDNLNTLYLYNYIRGQLRDIPAVGTGPIYVSFFSGSAADTAPSGSALELVVDGKAVTHSGRKTIVTGSHVSTGIYSCSVALTSAATPLSTVYDVWFGSATAGLSYAASTKFFTGSVEPKTLKANRINPTNTYVTTITNLKSSYDKNETVRFRLFVREKDWSPTIYTKASTAIEGTNVVSGSYKIFRVIDELDVIPYGTGSNLETVMSYDITGSYFDLDMSMLEEDYAYGIKFSYYNNAVGSWVNQPEIFKFRVK